MLQFHSMKKSFRSALIPALFALVAVSASTAQTTITAIYGSGNPDTGWSSSIVNNVQLALRARSIDDNATPWTAGNIYNFAGGPSLSNPSLSSVNWEFSIISDVNGVGTLGITSLPSFGYQLSVDIDPTAGQNWVTINPLLYATNSLGTDLTPNGLGAEDGVYIGRTVAQNSLNFGSLPFLGGAGISGIFDFKLVASTPAEPAWDSPFVSVQMRVVIGQPDPSAVPEPATYGLIGAAVLVAGVGARRMRRNQAKPE